MQSKISTYVVDRGSLLVNRSGVKKRKKRIASNKATIFPFLTRKYKK
jgi:hypothetical protein